MSNYRDLKEGMEAVDKILGINDIEADNAQDSEVMDGSDVVKMNVPVLIRILELTREELINDDDIHFMVEKLIALKDHTITMSDFDEILSSIPSKQQSLEEPVEEPMEEPVEEPVEKSEEPVELEEPMEEPNEESEEEPDEFEKY